MGETATAKLKAWRKRHGLTMQAAGALIVVDGKAVDRATWFGWESKGKIPKPVFMAKIELLTGVDPNAFYARPLEAPPEPANETLPLLDLCEAS